MALKGFRSLRIEELSPATAPCKLQLWHCIKKICDLDLGWRMNWECVWKALDILRGRGDGTDKNTSTVDDPMSCRTFLRRNFKELEEAADAGKLERVLGANDIVLGYTRRSIRWLHFGGIVATRRHDTDSWLQHCAWKRELQRDSFLKLDFSRPWREKADWEL